MNKLSAALCLLPLLAGGCSLNRMAASQTGSMIHEGLSAYYEEQDLKTAQDSLLSNLKLMEVLLKNDPGSTELKTSLAQGYCAYAFMFSEDKEPERAKYFYHKGAAFTSDISATELKRHKKNLPGLFWNSFCRAGYIQLDLQNPDSIAELPALEHQTDELLKADPEYFYNGAHALKASLAASRPVMLGGKPELAKEHFEAALTGKGAYFQLNRFLYAKTYAVQVQDADLFAKLLGQAISDVQALPEQRLINEAVKVRSQALLEKKNELF